MTSRLGTGKSLTFLLQCKLLYRPSESDPFLKGIYLIFSLNYNSENLHVFSFVSLAYVGEVKMTFIKYWPNSNDTLGFNFDGLLLVYDMYDS